MNGLNQAVNAAVRDEQPTVRMGWKTQEEIRLLLYAIPQLNIIFWRQTNSAVRLIYCSNCHAE